MVYLLPHVFGLTWLVGFINSSDQAPAMLLSDGVSSSAQNPLPAYVKLPRGWETEYGGLIASGARLKGPDGELVFFPAYTRTGLVAAVQPTMDMQTRMLRAVIDGQRVDIALTSKNLLAVSFPSGDYWANVDNTKQAVSCLMVLLTHIDEAPKKSDAPAIPSFRIPSDRPDFPFLQLVVPFAYEKDTQTFQEQDYQTGRVSKVTYSHASWPEQPKWKYEITVCGGNLQVAEDSTKAFFARFTGRAGKVVTYRSNTAEPIAALLAILASMTRIPS